MRVDESLWPTAALTGIPPGIVLNGLEGYQALSRALLVA
jgi:hypothetical protein